MNEDLRENGAEPEQRREPRPRAAVSTGNPRINVAFPFGRIAVQEPSEVLRDLAGVVEQLAEQIVSLTRQVDAGQAKAADRLAAQATVLARRLGVG